MNENETRCDFSDLIVSSCAHCTGRYGTENFEFSQAETHELLARRGWFASSYPGHCGDCGRPFDEGSPITRNGDDGWLGACCAYKSED